MKLLVLGFEDREVIGYNRRIHVAPGRFRSGKDVLRQSPVEAHTTAQ